MQASNILKIVDIEGHDLPEEFREWLKEQRSPDYKDNLLKENLFNPESLFDSDEDELPTVGVVADTAQEIKELCDQNEAAYFRIIYR